MKVLLATPRTGSTFYLRYLQLMNPKLECKDEYFQPYLPFLFNQPYLERLRQNEFDEITHKLNSLNNNFLIKILAGREIDFRVWHMLHNKQVPVTILKRRNLRRQIISFGISILNNVWVKFDNGSYGLNGSVNNVDEYKFGFYEKWWFDSLIYKFKQVEYLKTYLNIIETIYYEDIIYLKYPINDYSKKIIPIKQNHQTDDELMNYFTNKDQVDDWINQYLGN